MAKKKDKDEILETLEEEVIEEVVEEEEVIEESPVEEPVDTDKFIYTQLTMINKLNNPAKARRLADRVLRNKK